jgi:hypothetical protein
VSRRGNPAARARAQQRVRLRIAHDVDLRDVGLRGGVAERFGILDEAPAPDVAFRRCAWLWFQRDPETGLLPFGVW